MEQSPNLIEYLWALLRDELVLYGLRYLLVGGAIVIGTLLFGRNYKKRIAALEEQLAERQAAQPDTEQPVAESPTADYIEVDYIITSYIHSAILDMRDGVKISIRRDFLDRFEKTTGAKVGPYEYNRKLLHQWMPHNAARFLVEHRGEMG